MQLITPTYWKDYELLDCGGFEKLERYGDFILRRPEPQAVWDKAMADQEWIEKANASFIRTKGQVNDDNERGEWNQKNGMPGQWFVSYHYKEMKLKFRLGLTSFKHVGLFPEQADNWNYIYDTVSAIGDNAPVLNLFAYTGGASLAAKAAGADVTHVDSVKQVVTWSKENMQASGLDNIRWVVEDAMKFVKREVRREKKYSGIILDPPAYGRGPEGEKWVLESQLNELLHSCSQLLSSEKHFVVLNLYSMGYSSLIAENLIRTCFTGKNTESGEFLFTDKASRRLPLGIFSRTKNF